MHKQRVGVLTFIVLAAGLLAFVALLPFPGTSRTCIQITMWTPIAASASTSLELLLRKKIWSGLSLLAAICVVVASVEFS
ncbi:MAG: hypothetical protein HND42_09635 [Armatimonadetes bacterium]|nr:hypothetical protein [Armatimonadota bacterium]MDL1929170.1 hypothetical protein [Fimbriimonadia bacterium ATM]NOG93487.1 hypothetical protein [Armatimonadota bacterium]